MQPDRLRVVVSGMVAGVPNHGGATWAVLQWVLGLRQLGHDVLLVEPVSSLEPKSCAYFDEVVTDFNLGGRAALVTAARRTHGMPYGDIVAHATRADLLINIAGMLRDPELSGPVATRAYLDLDPAFTQLWQAVEGIDMGFDGHTHFITVGLNIGRPECDIPTCGKDWITTLPPVVLDLWPLAETPPARRALTTVANWRGYGSVAWNGRLYGQKAHSWRDVIDIPARSPLPCTPALAIHPGEHKDLARLDEFGWQLLDPADAAGSPGAYQRFIAESFAELGIAKSGYVLSNCGWFSDRSACYLATGRPVIAQDTGWTHHLPSNEGLFSFRTADDVTAAVQLLMQLRDPSSSAARALAAEHLDARVVIGAVLARLASTGRRYEPEAGREHP